jgi:hypothetical protein
MASIRVVAFLGAVWAVAGCSPQSVPPGNLSGGLATADVSIDAPVLADVDAGDTSAAPDTPPDLDPCPGGCEDDNPCTTDTCATTGCVHAPLEGSACGTATCAGSVWHNAGTCHAGSCQPGATSDCHDANPCTTDTCTIGGCVHSLADGEPCGPGGCTGLAWRGKSLCAGGSCTAGVPIPCDDGNPCTLDTCSATDGCKHAFSGALCDDGNACTTGESCTGGTCGGGKTKTCQDGNPCTTDVCKPGPGCVHAPSAGKCDDGDACTVGDLCGNGVCVAGLLQACDDGTSCTIDSCKAGVCSHLVNPKACDDGNVCTADACQTSGDCVHVAVGGACVGPACAGETYYPGGQCLSGACVSVSAVVCEDLNACTLDSCTAKGCQHKATVGTCDDGNACTLGDACQAGLCAPGKTKTCDDGNPCTTETCVGGGCVGKPVANGSACDDGVACTTGDVCAGGQCAGKSGGSSATYGTTPGQFAAAVGSGTGVVAAGWQDGAGGKTSDGWLVRADTVGGTTWSRTFGGAADDQLTTVAVAAGGYALAGFTGSLGSGDIDGWLLRTDAEGNLLWQKSFGGDKYDAVYGLAVLAGGDLALSGVSGNSAWLVRTDAAGKLVWQQTFETGKVSAYVLAATPDGGLGLAGPADTPTGTRARLIRTDGQGDALWAQDYGGTQANDVFALTGLADGFALAGELDTATGPRAWLVRTDGNGKVLWSQTYGKAGVATHAFGLTVLTGGGFALVGASGAGEALVVRTDSQGQVTSLATLPDALGLAVVVAGQDLLVAGGHQAAGQAVPLGWLARVVGCGL